MGLRIKFGVCSVLAGHEAKKVVAGKAYDSWALSEMVHSMECMR